MNEAKLQPLTIEWLRKAQDDEATLQLLLKEKTALMNACFHAQQLGEKCLKAYLSENDQRIPKIHQLEKLLKLCQGLSMDFKQLENEAVLLSGYYIESRYPGDYPEGITIGEATSAQKAALKIKNFIFSKFGL